MKSLALLFGFGALLGGGNLVGRDFFELPPILYSETASNDEVARWAGEIMRGEWTDDGSGGKTFLKKVLKRLQVPEESQVLVFSKTSLQNSLIERRNPRALYFSMNAYVGWVPGGKVEVIIEDEKLGPVFYTIDPPMGGLPPRIVRATDSCLQCHATSRTSGVPGMFVRSVVPDQNSQPVLNLGTSLVTDQTPMKERWGGWYVSGTSGGAHLGNRWVRDGESDRSEMAPQVTNLPDLSSLIDTEKYLRPTSDIVALMTLEHQCRIHNLMTRAKMSYRRAVHFQVSFREHERDDEEGMSWKIADRSAREIVEALTFRGEADPGGDGVKGTSGFAEHFESGGVKSSRGESLREFRLYGRLFKHRCSYMIRSKAFQGLPDLVKERVFVHLRDALSEAAENDLGRREKITLRRILEETVPGFKKES